MKTINDFRFLTALVNVWDEDPKEPFDKPTIMKGDKVEFINEFQNYQGKYITVKFNGLYYTVKPGYFDGSYIVRRDTRYDPYTNKFYSYITDSKGKMYKQIEGEKNILELEDMK